MHTTYAAANANGWNEACQWFLQLSRVAGVQAWQPNDELRLKAKRSCSKDLSS
jgi:hypothetical protein